MALASKWAWVRGSDEVPPPATGKSPKPTLDPYVLFPAPSLQSWQYNKDQPDLFSELETDELLRNAPLARYVLVC